MTTVSAPSGQPKISVHPSRTSCTIDDHELFVGDKVEYRRYGGKIVKGKVVAFALVDEKDMKSPWVFLTETVSGTSDWYPLVSMQIIAYHKVTKIRDEEADEMKGLFSQHVSVPNDFEAEGFGEPEEGDSDGMF